MRGGFGRLPTRRASAGFRYDGLRGLRGDGHLPFPSTTAGNVPCGNVGARSALCWDRPACCSSQSRTGGPGAPREHYKGRPTQPRKAVAEFRRVSGRRPSHLRRNAAAARHARPACGACIHPATRIGSGAQAVAPRAGLRRFPVEPLRGVGTQTRDIHEARTSRSPNWRPKEIYIIGDGMFEFRRPYRARARITSPAAHGVEPTGPTTLTDVILNVRFG